jgi:LPS-assembly lipoprotein
MRVPILAALLLAAPLAGCAGFEPLYGQATGVAPALAGVAVVTPATRTGQLLREELEDEFRAGARARAPNYRLVVDVDQRRFPRGLRIDDTANRYELRLELGYKLFDVRTGGLVHQGLEPVYVTYDVVDQPYAGVAAHMDGEERAASEAARVIRENLARFFHARQATQTAAR